MLPKHLSLLSVAALFLLFNACCLSPKPNSGQHHKVASELGSLPVRQVVTSLANAVLSQEVTDALAKQKLAINAVKITLQLEDDTAGDAKVAVLATAEGTITRSTSKQLTLQFSVPDMKAASTQLREHRVTTAEPALNSKDLVAAILASTDGVDAGREMINRLNLTQKEIDYEVDFSLTKTASGGIDITVGSVGLTANATWTRIDGDQIVITLEDAK